MMHRPFFFRCFKTVITAFSSIPFPPNSQSTAAFFSAASDRHSRSPIGSPTRVQKLIASQSDPLLAKEIFDYASRQPNFQHTFSSYLILILKLGRSNHFSLVDGLVNDLKSKHHALNPKLFTYLIKIYGDANLPNKALNMFDKMIEFNFQPLPKHLSQILEILVPHRNYIKPAFELFKRAHKYGVAPNTKSYNILMRAFCFNGDVSVAYKLFNEMFKRDVMPDVESYRILMQGLCRKSQVNGAVDVLEDMLNKGYVPDSLSYCTLLNTLCRKKKLREAYKLLSRMKVRGCNPDIIHYNTIIVGFCREGRAMDACKVLEDMESNGCLPNLVSYRTLIGGLCDQGSFDEAYVYLEEMVSKGLSLHFSASHALVKGFCEIGKVEQACFVVEKLLLQGDALHRETWVLIVPRICESNGLERIGEILDKVLKVEIKGDTRVVEAVMNFEEYLTKSKQSRKIGRPKYLYQQ